MSDNQLVVIKHPIKDLDFKLPDRANKLDKGTVKKIDNAIKNGGIDNYGHMWVCCSNLHVILRVKTKADARYLLESIDKAEKINFGGKEYVSWASIISIITRRKEDNPDNKYLPLVTEIVNEIDSCSKVYLIRHRLKEDKKENIKKLKHQRIKMYNITRDELTGESLNNVKAQFSHIRSVSMYPDISDMIWNGLIVNADTHALITSISINDEDQLYQLCSTKGWDLGWYDIYMEYVEK
ncbi:hypothetical protein [Clostridium sp. C8-1-8]|uniref:hypothetical protein n=1 Tax=Clostridium sp. C8-1-8 TaxID=2698831 RepID=UPI00136832C5|nr:hypothetical protein [Clostridium sp. C8-1-8]